MNVPTYDRLFSAEEFKAEIAKPRGAALPVQKEVPSGVLKQHEDGTFDFVLSTATPDRSADVIAQAGWKLDNFRKNPVMLWAHDYSKFPVGKAAFVGVEGDQLVAKNVTFQSREVDKDGWAAGQMYKDGYLNAVSVGFRPLKWNWNEERAGGIDFHEQELLEFSAVPVPANPEALVAAKAAGIPIDWMVEWAERILDSASGGVSPGLVVPKQYAQRVWQVAKSSKKFSLPLMEKQEPGEFLLDDAVGELLSRMTKAVRKFSKALETTNEALGLLSKRVEALQAEPQPIEEPAAPSPKDIAKAVAEQVRQQLGAAKGRID